jgi:predicted DNA-binding transcriptional regulator YafY
MGRHTSTMTAKKHDYHKKLYRLVRILNRLDTEGKVSPRQLADEFNVNMRTAQRDLELINMAEFPLVAMTKGSYSFMPGFSLKRLPMSSEEASLLAFMCDIAQSMGGDFEKSFKSLHSKVVLTANQESPFHAILQVTPKTDVPFIEDLRKAINESRKVETRYSNAKTYRLRPLKIVFSDGFWYLFAQVEGRKYNQTFRLDRMTAVELLDERFEPPKDVDKLLQAKKSIWFGLKRITVLLKVSAEVAPYFKAAAYLPEQRIVRMEKDGCIALETKVSHLMEVRPTIFRWMPFIKVLKPRELREEVRGVVRAYLKEM